MDGDTHATDEEITQLCRTWTTAIGDRDEATMDALMADDFTFTDERGCWGKARFIENTGRWELVGMDFEDVLVRTYAEVAVMQARMALRARLDGREMSGQWHLTDIWARRGARWRVIARQWSRGIPPAATPAAR